MPKLRNLSSKEVLEILKDFGFTVAGQRGSHIKIKRETTFGNQQVLTIPNHKEIDKGTLKAIFKQASRFVSEEELRRQFYTD